MMTNVILAWNPTRSAHNYVSGICQTREGNIVTVERAESRVKMYTLHGQLIRSFKCLSPGGVAVDPEGHIVIAGQNAIHVYRRNGELLNTVADKSNSKLFISTVQSTKK